jgi:hypothetical protein
MRLPVILKLISFFILLSSAHGQSRADQYEFQRANQLIRSGKNLEAKTILFQLYKKYPQNSHYGAQYKEVLITLSDYSELIKVIQSELLKQNNNPILHAELIVAYYKLDAKDKALETLNSITATLLKLEVQYIQVSNIMIRNRLYEYAIILYKAADERFQKNGQYLYNVAYLHQRLQNYKDAFLTYIDYLKKDPNRFHSVSSQILNLMDQDESKQIILENLYQLKNNPVSLKLKISILLVEERYDDVFSIFKENEIKDETFILNVINKIKSEAKLRDGIEFLTILNQNYKSLKLIDTKETLISLYFNYYSNIYELTEKNKIANKIDSLIEIYPNKNTINFRLNYINHLLVDRFDTKKAELLLSSFAGDNTILNQVKVKKLLALLAFYKKDFLSAKSRFLHLANQIHDGWGAFYVSLITIMTEDSLDIKESINQVLRNKNGLKNPYLNDILNLAYTSKYNKNENFKELLYYLSINDYHKSLELLNSMGTEAFILKLSYQLTFKITNYTKCAEIIDIALTTGIEVDYWLLEQSKLYVILNQKEKSKEILKKMLLKYTDSYWADEARNLFNQL